MRAFPARLHSISYVDTTGILSFQYPTWYLACVLPPSPPMEAIRMGGCPTSRGYAASCCMKRQNLDQKIAMIRIPHAP